MIELCWKENQWKNYKKKELLAFKHNGFWQCMDTLREKNYLNSLYKNNKLKWLK